VDAFGRYTLGKMLLHLKQMCGRLIRSEEDRGLVVIVESRADRGYFRRLREALPPGVPSSSARWRTCRGCSPRSDRRRGRVTDLSGRAAVVTGAGTGIGRAVALRLARAGVRVALLGRRRALLDAVAAEAKGGAFVRSADVRDRAEVDRAFDEIAHQLGPLHVLVANAGVGGPNVVGGEDRFEEIVRTNLDGAYYCLRAFERHLAPGPEPRHAVVVSSCVARFGVPGISAYSAAKAGQLGLVRSLAAELAPRGVRVNAICPAGSRRAWRRTACARSPPSSAATTRPRAATSRGVPLQRISEPDEIAGLVEFLCSSDAAGFTGQAFDVNNGAWMG